MIFATVGTQLPFDRLIVSIDKWCENHNENKAFAQIGQTRHKPRNLPFAKTLERSQFAKNVADCTVIVSHAGMGTVFTALDARKPIILMARQSSYGEHRNDHQLATVDRLEGRTGIHIARDEEMLHRYLSNLDLLDRPLDQDSLKDSRLVCALSRFIAGEAL